MIVVNSSTRQFSIPGADLVFGVTADSGSERKYFQCPRYVGNNLDIAGSFVRMNYRNANGEIDSYLVNDVAVDGDNVVFSWELSPHVTMYKGNVTFVMCVVGPDTKVKWHTTLGRGQVLEGLEPDSAMVEEGTADVVAALIAMVEAQTEAVEKAGADQVAVVKAAAKTAESDAVAQIEAKGVNTLESIPADYTALSEAVDTLNRTRGVAIVCSAEGSAITVNDASDNYIRGLRIFGRSTQDGTPTPDAPVEIKSVVEPVVKVVGRNLLTLPYRDGATKTHGGLTYTVGDDGSVHVVGTVTAAESYFVLSDFNFGEKSVGMGKDNGVYFWSDCLYNMSRHFTMLYFSQGNEVDKVYYPQVELGTAATDFEPPFGQTISTTHTLPGIPVTSGGNYIDSDGQQWICDEVDLERGVYVQRVGVRVFTGTTETWKDGTISASGQHYVYLADANVTVLNGSVCSHGVSNYSGSWNTGSYWRSGTGLFQVFCDMSLSEWKDYLATQNNAGTPVSLQFVMDAPIETPLSETEIAAYRALHSNYPNTTVLNDAGAHMVVKYAADTKLYIDNKIAALVGGA